MPWPLSAHKVYASLAYHAKRDCVVTWHLSLFNTLSRHVMMFSSEQESLTFFIECVKGVFMKMCVCVCLTRMRGCVTVTLVLAIEGEIVPKHCHLVDGWSYWSLAVVVDRGRVQGEWHDTAEQDRESGMLDSTHHVSFISEKHVVLSLTLAHTC